MEGWYDSSEVGLGCILPDLTHHDIDEVIVIVIVVILPDLTHHNIDEVTKDN